MKINDNNDKSFNSASMHKASSMLSIIEDVNNQQVQQHNNIQYVSKRKDINPQPIISSLIAREVEELEQTYKHQDQTFLYRIYGILLLQLILSSLRGPLYLTIHKSSIIRAAWRQGFTALIYIPISIYELKNNKNYTISFKGQEFNLLMASVQNNRTFQLQHKQFLQYPYLYLQLILMFHMLLCFIIVHYYFIVELKQQQNSIVIFLNFLDLEFLQFYQQQFLQTIVTHFIQNKMFQFQIRLYMEIQLHFSEVEFLLYISIYQNRVSAKYYSKIISCCPTFTLFAIIRALSTVMLIVLTFAFDNQHNFFEFLEPILFTKIFFNALFTGVLMNQLQSYVQLFVDPLTYNSANFFQPLFGSIFSYFLGQESLPGSLSIICMILYSIGLLFIQIGRSKSETEDLKLDIELRQLDSVYFENNNPLLSIFQSNYKERDDQMKISLYKRKTIQRQQTKQFVDYSMDQ